jgi:tellurite methyltransferase
MAQESTIVRFQQDEDRDWVAELSCGHRQHMRHRPPLVERPWVLTFEGRASKIGHPIACAECARKGERR